nr:MAG TPA: hypothetical protein [Ackermannviridae sp.]
MTSFAPAVVWFPLLMGMNVSNGLKTTFIWCYILSVSIRPIQNKRG